jgi:signal transduction histidine kinase
MQCRSILAETFTQLREMSSIPGSLVSVEYGSAEAMAVTASVRAGQGVHPAEPLMAAEALFGIALPFVVDVARARSESLDGVTVARVLHHATWRRFPPGAIEYVEILRTKLSSAHQESRRRISLELHDRIAHGVAAGIQRIELMAMVLGDGGTVTRETLEDASRILRASLVEVQDLALELRQRVGERSIDAAIAGYLDDTEDLVPITSLSVIGVGQVLKASVAEEAFTIVLEAVRNARTHATGATRIDLLVHWTPDDLVIVVTDDGEGFDPSNVRARGIGLIGMKERADVIGAQLDVTSMPGGTKVLLQIPISMLVTQ